MPLIFTLQTGFGFALETLEVFHSFLGVLVDFCVKRTFLIRAVNDVVITFYFETTELIGVSLRKTPIYNSSRYWFRAHRTPHIAHIIVVDFVA